MRFILFASLLLATPVAAQSWQPNMSPGAWDWLYSVGEPAHPAGSPLAGWDAVLPQYAGSWPCPGSCPVAGYLMTGTPEAIPTPAYYLVATGQMTFSGNPVIHYNLEPGNNGTTPANMRFMVEVVNDNLGDGGRWWSNPVTVNFVPGWFQIEVQIAARNWSGVYGEFANSSPAARAAWLNTLAHPGRLGFTFGGGSFFGHGVNVSGGNVDINLTSLIFSATSLGSCQPCGGHAAVKSASSKPAATKHVTLVAHVVAMGAQGGSAAGKQGANVAGKQ